VGVTAAGAPDTHPVPLDSVYPGVGVNASLFNSLLLGKFIQRAGRFTNVLILALLCLVTYFISRRARKLFGFLLVFFFMSGYVVLATALFFTRGLWLDIFYPIIAVFLLFLVLTFMKYMNENRKMEILERELGIAKKIQESFLPKEVPRMPGMDIAAGMLTARQVGGDLYDFVKTPDERLGVMIGDVAGKGVPAALYMAKVVSEFKSLANENSASAAITKLNEKLSKGATSGIFVTVSYIIFDMKTNLASFSSGGHLPMIITNADSREERFVDSKEGMPLGLFEGTFSEEKINFAKGDTFILYTDGVTEAMNSKGEMFGEKRLADLAKSKNTLPAKELAALLQNEVKKFEGKTHQHDDITILVVKIKTA
jgi:hypothetical protein